MQVRILGPLEVSDGDGLLELGAGRHRALLAFLALHRRQAIATDRLIEELWGSAPPPTAGKVLQNLVSQLRRSLGADAIVTQPPGYRLQLRDEGLDAWTFEQVASEGRRLLDSDPRAAAERLREALELWRGPALADFAYEDFAQGEIARLEELRLGAIEDRVDGDLASGQSVELVPELEQLVRTNPLRERLRGQFMLALYRGGRQAEALEVFREARTALRDELGIEPGVALRELEQAILNQDPALGPPPRLPHTPTQRRRGRLALAVVALVLVGAVLAIVLATRGDDGAPTPAPNSVVQIDAETNEVVKVIPVGRTPGDVVAVGEYVFVSSEEDATLTRIDIDSNEVITSGASGADLGLASMGDSFIWAVSLQQERVTRVNAENLNSIDGIRLTPDLALAFVAVGGGSLWVTQYSPAAVLRYDLRSLRLQERYDVGLFEVPVKPTYAYGAAWVALGASRALLRIDALTGRARTIPAGARPTGPAFGFGSIWSASIDEGTLSRFDGLTGERIHPVIDAGRVPFGVATGAGSVWVASNCDGTVARIDPVTSEAIATVKTGYFPKWLAVGGGYVWVTLTGEAWDPELCN